MKLSPEEVKASIEAFEAGDFCEECGGRHFRACPRVQSYTVRYSAENPAVVVERTISYFPPGSWENDVLFRDDLYEEDESDNVR